MIRRPLYCSGFTLLELLIAIAIFAVLAAMAYSGLNNVLITSSHAQQKAERLGQLQWALTIMQRDIEQSIDRSIRDSYGNSDFPMKSSQAGYGNQLEFTRIGRADFGLPRSSLVRIAYRVEDKKLYRMQWQALDRAQDATPYEQVLLTDVKELTLRFMDAKGTLQDDWPPTSSLINQPVSALPTAVFVELDTEAFGHIERLFPVASGS
jgi:general secretion pathway protein J